MLPHMREPKTCTEMATEKPTLPAPEEQVSPAAEDAQANPAVTVRVPEPEMPAAGPAAEASAAAEEPVAEVADAPAEAVTETPAAETPAEEAAAERISGEEAAPRAKRARIKPAAGQEVAESEEDASRDVQVDFADEEAALAAQNAGLEIEGATPEEEAAEELAAQKPEEDKFAGKGKEELVALFARMLEEQPVQSIRRDVEALKIAFYRIRRAEVEAARRRFIEEGGAEEDFAPSVDGAEIQLKEQFKEYRRRRDAFIANLEAEKEANLKVKQAIIEELKELVNSDETLNHTFNKFRELQQRWKDTGIVPQQHVKDLWETYNLHVENFYSFIKINKELRDLDLKKNYEQKVALCEQAEALILEPSVVEAFRKLQKLHDEWRETGPVANEYKEALWERFKAASSRINKQHQEHFETLKGEQVKNLELKTGLCVATEELSSQPLTTRKEWNRASDRLLEIQKTWKTIGFAPKKDNNRIYERFRTACDRFFEAKRQFYAGVKAEMEHIRSVGGILNLPEADSVLNDLNREKLKALKELHGHLYLGRINIHDIAALFQHWNKFIRINNAFFDTMPPYQCFSANYFSTAHINFGLYIDFKFFVPQRHCNIILNTFFAHHFFTHFIIIKLINCIGFSLNFLQCHISIVTHQADVHVIL